MLPKVSVIIPIYNVREYLEKAITSVVNQTFKELEIICVNNGASEEEALIINKFASEDSRIKVITFEQNQGYGKAVNAGIESASGEYIAILESDDWCESEMYEKLYKQVKLFDADICKCGFNTYNSTLPVSFQCEKWKSFVEDIEKIPSNKNFTIKDEPNLFMIHASIWAGLYKREFLDKNNIRMIETKYASYQDFPFMAEILCKANSITVIHDYLYHWRVEPNQQSSTKCNNQKLFLMIEQCERVKQVVKENGLYDILKSQMYRHFASANLAFFKEINKEYRKEYFEKCSHLFKELKNDKEFSYKYCTKGERKFIESVISNKYWQNYGFVFLRKSIFSIHWNKKEKRVILFGKEFFRRDYHR